METLLKEATLFAAKQATVGSATFHALPESKTFFRAAPTHLGGGKYIFIVQETEKSPIIEFPYSAFQAEYKKLMAL